MKSVKIAGVPEHFNFPWKLCIENGEFEERGIDLQWTDIPEGTGKLCELLRNKETDLAIILTEGILKDISFGNPSLIIQEFVSSPLLWGIHVAADATFQNIEDLEHKRIAISRYGSGSHLMAIVHAKQMNWDINTLSFVVVNTLDGAVQALSENKADYFMWERFMTQPIVDAGIFRRLDVCPTPWPSFLLVGHRDFIQENPALIDALTEVINTTTTEFKSIPSIDRTLALNFNQKVEDIQEWMQVTQWSQHQISEQKVQRVQEQLQELGLIETQTPFNKLINT